MYCPECGNKSVGYKYCENCGTLLNYQIKNNNGSDYEKISLVLGIVGVVLSISTFILGIIPSIISICYAFKYKKISGKLGIGFWLSIGAIIYAIIMLLLYFLLMYVFCFFIDGLGV